MEEKNLLFTLADSLVKRTYKLTLNFPYRFQSSIGDQLRRAILSVVLNLVEGGARSSPKEKRQFLNIAYSSLKEAKYLLYFSQECKIINIDEYNELIKDVSRLAALFYGLLRKRRNL